MRYAFVMMSFIAFLAAPLRAEVSIQEVTSPEGFQAWLVEESSLPFTALEIRFRGGTAQEPASQRGVTNLMMGLLEEGAGDMDARAYSEAREALATSINFGSYGDTVTISAQFLTENQDAAIELLRMAIAEPRFDETAIERVRQQVLSSLNRRTTDPSDILSEYWDNAAYGDHPYGSYDGGTKSSVLGLTRADIVESFKRSITRDNVVVGAVGDMSADELAAIMDRLFVDLPAGEKSALERVEFGIPQGTTVVPFETPQSVARFGHSGFSRDHPDFFAAYILSEIIGGQGANSRLMQEVREKRGLTYGVGTSLFELDFTDGIVGQFSSQNDKMAEAIDVVKSQWARIANDGITQEELTAAQTYLTGAYPLRFDGNGPIANILVAMQMNGLPIDYIATRNEQVMAVTLAQANRVAKELFRPDELAFVVVGQPTGMTAE